MKSEAPTPRERLMNLADALVEDILNMSDEDLRAELEAEDVSIDEVVAMHLRAPSSLRSAGGAARQKKTRPYQRRSQEPCPGRSV